MNEFINDPLCIHVLNKDLTPKQTFILVGNVSKEIQHLIKIKSPKLKDHYGPNWKKKLLLHEISGGKKDSKNLENLENDIFENETLENETLENENLETLENENLENENLENENDPFDSLDSFEDAFLNYDESKVKIKLSADTKIHYIFDEISVFPIDSILDFKYKLAYLTSIPIYKQHLFIKSNGKIIPCMYSYTIHDIQEIINIETLYTKTVKDKIFDIPIETKCYDSNKYIKIISNDPFTLLSTIYLKYKTTTFYISDLSTHLSIPEFSKKITDPYQISLFYYGFISLYYPMITHQVFTDMLKNQSLSAIYPILEPNKFYLQNKLSIESKILNTTPIPNLKKLSSAILSTNIKILNTIQDNENLLNIRNIFDLIPLDDFIVYAKLSNSTYGILNKSYKNEHDNIITPINSLMYKIRPNLDLIDTIRLFIYPNGNYTIKCFWSEESQMNFDTTFILVSKIVNKLISQINTFGNVVKSRNIHIPELQKNYIEFTETSLVFYYDDDLTDTKFKVIKNILLDFQKAEIIFSKESVTSSDYQYFFNKGMYEYDISRLEKNVADISNYYQFLSDGFTRQKFKTVFVETRLMTVIGNLSKLKITINGIKNNEELQNFIYLLHIMITLYIKTLPNARLNNEKTQIKNLKSLKVQDPLLFNFKKIYKTNTVYSKICQKPFQPVILSDDDPKPKNAVKFYNFTKQKPVWYTCPNPKYPHLKFIIKQHPKDFCIPCCKKHPVDENANEKRLVIHNTCMEKYKYEGEKNNLISKSSYISTYGKNTVIEPGRLSRLPENTLESIFFDTYSNTNSIDYECSTADGYYIFGVDQNLLLSSKKNEKNEKYQQNEGCSSSIQKFGYIHCLAASLDFSISKLLLNIYKNLKNDCFYFNSLYSGEIKLYFKNCTELADIILTLNSEKIADTELPVDFDWNKLFISIAYFYLGINTIIFEDKNSDIRFILPPDNEVFSSYHKNLFVLKQEDRYNPIFLFNTEIFKRTGIINTRLFLTESTIVATLKSIVNTKVKISQKINLMSITKYCETYNYKITKYYINKNNLCYAVDINKNIYIPVHESKYSFNTNMQIEYSGTNFTKSDINDIYTFIKQFNKLFPTDFIEISKYLHYKNKCIGVVIDNLNFYINEINEMTEKKYILQYHPHEINSIIEKNPEIKFLNSIVSKDYYKYYLFNLTLYQYINLFNTKHNTTVRKKLIKLIEDTDFSKSIDDLKKFINKFDEYDLSKIRKCIHKFNLHNNKKLLIEEIEANYYNFDRELLNQFFTYTKEQAKAKLTDLAKNIIVFKKLPEKMDIKMFMPCNNYFKPEYCTGNLLIMDKSSFEEIIDKISEIIIDKNKSYIFNGFFINDDYLKFIKRKNETISYSSINE